MICGVRTARQVLLVCEYQQEAILHLTIAKNAVQLLLCLVYPLLILAIDDEDKTLRAGVVVPPQRPNLILPTDIPYVELDVLVCDGLNVESN